MFREDLQNSGIHNLKKMCTLYFSDIMWMNARSESFYLNLLALLIKICFFFSFLHRRHVPPVEFTVLGNLNVSFFKSICDFNSDVFIFLL